MNERKVIVDIRSNRRQIEMGKKLAKGGANMISEKPKL